MAEYTEGARVYHSSAQSIPKDTDTALAFNSTRWDTDEIHDPVTNNSRLTCKTAGKYVIFGQAHLEWNAGQSGIRIIKIRLNGATEIIEHSWERNNDGPTRMNCATIWNMGVNDYVELVLHHGDTVSRSTIVTGNTTTEFMMQRVG